MPATTSADRFDIATGLIHRTCRECSTELPLTAANFYQRDGRPYERRCQTCRHQRDAANRAARRAGRGVRTGRKFGVEIEFIGDADDVARELRRLRVPLRDSRRYTHDTLSVWKIVTDSSVDGGYELVSPPLSGTAGLNQLKLACEALVAAGASVDRSCGLHVHHDVSDLEVRDFGRLFRGWSNNQLNIDGLVAPSRRDASWCRAFRPGEVARIEQASSTTALRGVYIDRYRALNIAAYPRYGTVEVRQHQGTINFDKITAWIAFGQSMITLAKSADGDITGEESTVDLIALLGRHGLTAEQVAFLGSRAAHFAGRRSPVAA